MTDGEVLKIIRTVKGYSQDGVARDIGISQQSFSKWEHKDEIPDEMLKFLLKVLKSSRAEFDVIKNLAPPPHTHTILMTKFSFSVA